MNLKRGEPVPGSKYVRDFCAACGEPMRVVSVVDDFGRRIEHTCGTCRANLNPGAGRPGEQIYPDNATPWQENNIRLMEDGQ